MGTERLELSTLAGYGSEPYAYTNSATCPLKGYDARAKTRTWDLVIISDAL